MSDWIALVVNTDDTIDCGDITMRQVGTAASGHRYYPILPEQNKSYTQQLYLASEVNHEAGEISSIAFNYYWNTATQRPITVYMGNTNVSNLSAGFLSVNAMTKVFETNCYEFNRNNNTNWPVINLDTPFEYTGGNIVVAVVMHYNTSCRTQVNTTNRFYYTAAANMARRYNTNTVTTSSITFNASGMPEDNNTTLTNGNTALENIRPNIRFNFCTPIDICPAVTNLTATLDEEDPTEKANIAWQFDTADYLTGFEVIVSTNEIANPRSVMLANVSDKTTGDTLVYHINEGEDVLSQALSGLRHNRQYYVYVRTNIPPPTASLLPLILT